MNASELTFGIEIETTASMVTAVANSLTVGSYHRGVQVPYLLLAGWPKVMEAFGPRLDRSDARLLARSCGEQLD